MRERERARASTWWRFCVLGLVLAGVAMLGGGARAAADHAHAGLTSRPTAGLGLEIYGMNPDGGPPPYQIYIMNPDGSGLTNLSNGPDDDAAPD